LSACRII